MIPDSVPGPAVMQTLAELSATSNVCPTLSLSALGSCVAALLATAVHCCRRLWPNLRVGDSSSLVLSPYEMHITHTHTHTEAGSWPAFLVGNATQSGQPREAQEEHAWLGCGEKERELRKRGADREGSRGRAPLPKSLHIHDLMHCILWSRE